MCAIHLEEPLPESEGKRAGESDEHGLRGRDADEKYERTGPPERIF